MLLVSSGRSARSLEEAPPAARLDTPVDSKIASEGRVRLFVGQDSTSIGDYIVQVKQTGFLGSVGEGHWVTAP